MCLWEETYLSFPTPSQPLFPLIHRSCWTVGLWGTVTSAHPLPFPGQHVYLPPQHQIRHSGSLPVGQQPRALPVPSVHPCWLSLCADGAPAAATPLSPWLACGHAAVAPARPPAAHADGAAVRSGAGWHPAISACHWTGCGAGGPCRQTFGEAGKRILQLTNFCKSSCFPN